MTDLQNYTVQVKVEDKWFNFYKSRDLFKAIQLSARELSGHPFRILGYDNGKWIECLVSGTMLSVENKDFRKLRH